MVVPHADYSFRQFLSLVYALLLLFIFLSFQGFDALNYEEHLDYELVQSTNPEFNKVIF